MCSVSGGGALGDLRAAFESEGALCFSVEIGRALPLVGIPWAGRGWRMENTRRLGAERCSLSGLLAPHLERGRGWLKYLRHALALSTSPKSDQAQFNCKCNLIAMVGFKVSWGCA